MVRLAGMATETKQRFEIRTDPDGRFAIWDLLDTPAPMGARYKSRALAQNVTDRYNGINEGLSNDVITDLREQAVLLRAGER